VNYLCKENDVQMASEIFREGRIHRRDSKMSEVPRSCCQGHVKE